ncbi:MAG: hypothetical protein KC421_16385, partial [Anaerolineales bacterium]|nr:hypothetical protein [Anaerolineales bacterium]
FPQQLTVTNNFTLGRYGEIELSVNGRLYQPTNVVLPGTAANDLQDLNNRSRIQLDDGSNVQNPVPLPPYFNAEGTLRLGDTTDNLTAVMGYGFGVYELQPVGPVAFNTENPRTDAPDVGGSVQVASFNVLNYFTTIDDSGPICGPLADQGCRGADTADEFTRQHDKIVDAIVKMDADVVGLIEIENHATDDALQFLV